MTRSSRARAALTAALLFVAASCADLAAERRQRLLDEYLALHVDRPAAIRAALESGRVVVGMTHEEAFLASGVRASGSTEYSIWRLDGEGRLRLPSTAGVPRGRLVEVMRSATQFEGDDPVCFAVFYDADDLVTRVSREVVVEQFGGCP